MNREVAPGVFSIKPDDVIIYTNKFGFQRQYRVLSVVIGSVHEESYVEVETIHDASVPLYFPEALLQLALKTGECQIYEG